MKLPDFVCVGAMRCGTTTLWNELRAHPEIFLPDKKELHFFDADYANGLQIYANYFEQADTNLVCGEITPSYMYQKNWFDRLSKDLPEAKIIAILRDPVERAWSHYKFSALWGPESLSFRNAIDNEHIRIAEGHQALIYYSYISRGFYVDQLEHIAARIGRRRILIIFIEELINDRQNVLRQVQDFLELEAEFSNVPAQKQNEIISFPRSLRVHQISQRIVRMSHSSNLLHRVGRRLGGYLRDTNMRKAAPSLPENVRLELRQIYAPYNERLEEFIDRPLPW